MVSFDIYGIGMFMLRKEYNIPLRLIAFMMVDVTWGESVSFLSRIISRYIVVLTTVFFVCLILAHGGRVYDD